MLEIDVGHWPSTQCLYFYIHYAVTVSAQCFYCVFIYTYTMLSRCLSVFLLYLYLYIHYAVTVSVQCFYQLVLSCPNSLFLKSRINVEYINAMSVSDLWVIMEILFQFLYPLQYLRGNLKKKKLDSLGGCESSQHLCAIQC